MTSPLAAGVLGDRIRKMKRAAVERDHRMLEISLIRQGKPELLFPDLFSATWRKPVVSNFIDTVAREFAEMLAPLPALNCSSGGMKSDADKRRAGTRNKIGGHIWEKSSLRTKMISAADAYFSYGFAAFVAEADYVNQRPVIRVLPSVGTYYDNDRDGNTLRIAHCYRETVGKIAALFPEVAPLVRSKKIDAFGTRVPCSDDDHIEVVWFSDDQQTVLFTPERDDLLLASYPSVTGKCTARVAERPGLFSEPVGQFDGVIWIQLARHRMAMLGIEAGVKAVGAPLAVPRDVAEIAIGADAVMVSESPEKIRRVGIDVPQSTFALEQTLQDELRQAARYPEGRSGQMEASVITGRGVQALQGSFDTQISTAQTVFAETLARVTEFAFCIDAKVWPNSRKRITGQMDGEAYDLTYVPARDVGDDCSVACTYGFAAGLSPNAAVVMMLQLRGDGLVDRDTVRRNLPWAVDAEQMQRNLDVEQTADALKQGLFGLLQGLGPMAAQGMDPRPFLRTAAEIVKGRQNGKPLEQLFIDAFAPDVQADPAAKQDPDQDQAQDQAAGTEGGPAGGGGGPALPGQDATSGLPAGITPGQAGQAPGGAPDLQTLVAGLRNGKPQLDAAVTRRLPTA